MVQTGQRRCSFSTATFRVGWSREQCLCLLKIEHAPVLRNSRHSSPPLRSGSSSTGVGLLDQSSLDRGACKVGIECIFYTGEMAGLPHRDLLPLWDGACRGHINIVFTDELACQEAFLQQTHEISEIDSALVALRRQLK